MITQYDKLISDSSLLLSGICLFTEIGSVYYGDLYWGIIFATLGFLLFAQAILFRE
jgi:hypothetical protein